MEISNYLSIGALIISGASLFLSWRVSRRDRIRGEYSAKRDLFFATKHYLDNLRKRKYSSDEEERLETSLDKGTQRKTTENELPSLTQCTA